MNLVGTSSWAERHVSLFGRKFRRSDYIQFLEPMEWIDRMRGKTFILRYPPQCGKTLTMQLLLLRSVDMEPCQVGWYAKTSVDAKMFAHEKLVPLIRSTPSIMRKYPISIDERGSDIMHRFTGGPVSMLSAEVQAHRNSHSFQLIFMDEAWQYEKGAVKEIVHRADSYPHTHRIVIGETAPDDGAETVDLYNSSCQRVWHFACPMCGQQSTCEHGDPEQVWGLRWDKTEETYGEDGFWKPQKAAKTARWVCSKCGESVKYSASTLQRMNDPERGAGYVTTNPDSDPNVIGWRATAMVFRAWEGIVQDYLHAINTMRRGDDSLLREHTMKSRMVVWKRTYNPSDDEKKPFGEYNLREPWAEEGKFESGAPMRIIAVDVQIGHYWVTCRSFDQNALYSRLYDFALCYSAEEVNEFRQACGVGNEMVYVDTGFDQKSNRMEVYGAATRMCAKYGWDGMNGIDKHEFPHRSGVRRPFSEPFTRDAWQGTGMQGQFPLVTVWHYSTASARGMLRDIRDSKDPQGNPYWTIARDTPENYLKQAWARRFVENKDENKWEWKQFAEDDHAQDCEGMILMVCLILGLATSREEVTQAPVDGV